LFKKDNLETPTDKVNTVIGKETSFSGTINGNGLIRIDGSAEGNINNQGDVIVGESGSVAVELKARNVTIAGHYEGTLEAEGRLELKKTGTAIGTFKVNGLLVEAGAVLAGSMEMPDAEIKHKGKEDKDAEVKETSKKESVFGKADKTSSANQQGIKDKERQVSAFGESTSQDKSL